MALIACPDCHAEVSDRAPACPRCGCPFTPTTVSPVTTGEAERRQAFEARIAGLVDQGFRIVSRTDTTAQLVRPKTFSFVWATLWFLVCGVGVLVYLFWYAAKSDDVVYVSLDDTGAGLPAKVPGGFCRACRRWVAAGAGRCPHCETDLPIGPP
jgi:RNA polymerase subunit RPABC4/transcription elongation factor Spt4